MYFGHAKASVNYLIDLQLVAYFQILEHAPLFAGYQKGDRVRAVRDFPATGVVGDEGTVLGPSTIRAFQTRTSVCLCHLILVRLSRITLLASTILSRYYSLVGDLVRALVPYYPKNVKVGDQGTVVESPLDRARQTLTSA